MVTVSAFKKLASALPEVTEQPHFEKTSFRIKKKIFVALDEKNGIATFKFSLINQSVFCTIDAAAVYPVPNKWGKSGWTHVVLSRVTRSIVKDALEKAYEDVLHPQKPI